MTTPRETEAEPATAAGLGADSSAPPDSPPESLQEERAPASAADAPSVQPADVLGDVSEQPAAAREPEAVPRAGAPTPAADPGPGWAQGPERAAGPAREEPTTVLPGGRRAAPPRAVPPRPVARAGSSGGARPAVGRSRRARLSLRRIDPWSVFLFSLVASVFLGIALVVAVAVLYAVLGSLGVTASINQLFAEVTGGSPATDALLTSGRIIGGAAVLAAVNVVFLTLLSTLGALLYNLCASFTGGLELTLGERD